MAHLSPEELIQRLAAAAAKIDRTARYIHYKSPDHSYTISGFAIMEATDEAAVIYTNDAGIAFIRPVTSFLETVSYNGTQVPRFNKVA